MFGARRRVPRPVLLILVYGIFLVIVGVTAMAQTALVSADFSATALNSDGRRRRGPRPPVRHGQPVARRPRRDRARRPTAQAALEKGLAQLVRPGQIVRIEVRLPDGRVVAADDPAVRGGQAVDVAGLRHGARPGRPPRPRSTRSPAARRSAAALDADACRPRVLPARHRWPGPGRRRRLARRRADPRELRVASGATSSC